MRPRELTIPVGALQLDSGETLSAVEQRVTIYGEPNADGSNVVLAAHALTGSSRIAEWWPAIAAEDAVFDLSQWCVIGINALGSCYGSTGPATMSSSTGGVTSGFAKEAIDAFPRITVRDIVRAQQRAIDHLGVERLAFVIGGSLGGMQALQWAVDAPQRVSHAVVIGAHDHHSAMGIAFNAVQREGLALDPIRGLRLARKIALLTYKSQELFAERHSRRPDRLGQSRFDVEGYLEYQADRFEGRMDAATYVTLTHAMDSFDVRDALTRGSEFPQVTFIGISSDWLFRPDDVQAASERFRLRGLRSKYIELTSSHGHDAFLVESTRLVAILRQLLPHFSSLAQSGNGLVHAPSAAPTTGPNESCNLLKPHKEGAVARHECHGDDLRAHSSITVSKGLAFFSVRPREHDEGQWLKLRVECLAGVAENGVPLEMLQFTPLRMRFIVDKSVVKTVQAVVQDCGLAWRLVSRCSKVCIVGDGIRTTAGIFYKTLTGLAARGIPVLHFSDSDVNMSFVVADANGTEVESFLHDVFTSLGGSSSNSPISFDATLCKVRVNGEERRLGSRQAKLLEFLVNNVGRVVEANEAATHLFGANGREEVAALRVHLHNLRKKIEADPENPRYIVTVPDQGYVFVR